eukprot:XP_015570819.1 protein SMG7L [Ricinus communis]
MAGQSGFPTPIKDTNNSLKDQKEKPAFLIEVADIEKQLWALIHIKGLLHSDVQALYHRICSTYEKIILSDHEVSELQDIEYSLWKLHYRHIDEFRKRIKKSSGNGEATKCVTSEGAGASRLSSHNHAEGFKSFLLEATRFYQNLSIKIKRNYGLPGDFCFCKRGGNSVSVEPREMQKLQFLCHRFLVCLGDLARYREQFEKSDVQNQDWSVAVKHYLEATKIWPHSGNPQNQLAVLATYVGDEFLALYHCIRSLAVREPFPDAWNNLILLFERNRASPLQSLSNEVQFDVLNPSESTSQSNTRSSNDTSNCKMVDGAYEGSRETHLWSLFIRMISFFFIKSSLKDFPCTLASTLKELDILLALDDRKLNAELESYQAMDSARTGPFRTLQVVSIFIFVIENLMSSPEARDCKNKNDLQQFELMREAWTAAFIFMGRLANRCLKANVLDACPLLPALLVFSEWLVSILDQAENYGSDEKCTSDMLYFLGAFLEILRRIDNNKGEVKAPGSIALWEDYELRGFAPVACSHVSLDFSTHWTNADSYKSGTQCRAHRIINTAIKISDRSNSSQEWICHDKLRAKFYVPESNKCPQRQETEMVKSLTGVDELKDCDQHIPKMTKESKMEEKPSNSPVVSKSIATEDEEVILFKPLTRYNSAPLYGGIMANDQMKPEDTVDQTVLADECLRRATSVLIAQNQAQDDPSAFHSDFSSFRCNKSVQQQDEIVHLCSEASNSSGPPSFSTSLSTGPPSLNAWVLDRGSLSNDRVKGKRDMNKHSIPPIEEVASASLDYLSISSTVNSVISSGHEPVTIHNSSIAYSAPVPSAPFLPDDAVWINGIQSTLSNYNGAGNLNRTNNLFDASQVSGYSNRTGSYQPLDYGLNIPGFIDGCPPMRRMTSSEWLRQYRENHNLERTPSHVWPGNAYAAVNTGNLYGNDMSKSGLFEQFGVPLVANPLIYEESSSLHSGFPPGYGTVEHRREKLYHGYQRPSPYGCGAANEPQPLLQYLKEKEWLLQQDPTLRGPTFMGG